MFRQAYVRWFAAGAYKDVAAEFYRVVLAKYEDQKIEANGYVSSLDEWEAGS